MTELPLPKRLRFLPIVTVSEYTPSQTMMVSPATLAFTAAWIEW